MTLMRLVTALLVCTLLGLAAPAQADKASPEASAAKLWKQLGNGQGNQAFNAIEPRCRTPKRRAAVNKVADRIDKAISKAGDGRLSITDYTEKSNTGKKATVAYVVTLTSKKGSGPVVKVRKQKWVRDGSRWFVTC